jgi:hypothetical protein
MRILDDEKLRRILSVARDRQATRRDGGDRPWRRRPNQVTVAEFVAEVPGAAQKGDLLESAPIG